VRAAEAPVVFVRRDKAQTMEEVMAQTGLTMKYFVLNPNKNDRYGLASREAILAYARSIQVGNPILAYDLREWVKEVRLKISLRTKE